MVLKNLKIGLCSLPVLTQYTNVTDGQTYRQTPHGGIWGRAAKSEKS